MQAICREFLPWLDTADRQEEELRLVLLEESGEDMTPEECEAAARPNDAGDYWTPWDIFRIAQQIFADEVAQIDGGSRDKTDKKTFGNRTVAICKWFNKLPKSKIEEPEKAITKWNSEGAPNKDKMLV